MANEVGGAVIWDLDVDKQKLSAGLASARKEINDLANEGEKRFSSFAKTISNSMKAAEADSQKFLGAVSLVGGSILAAGGFALKSAGEMEMLRSSLNTLTGSAEAGATVFKDLNKFAASTPFETGDLAKASETMLAFGINSKQVLPNLQMLGDISLGNAEKLSGLSLAFSQVASTGRLMGQDLLQMINQGFNPLTIISQKTGRSMTDLKDAMAEGEISFEMVRDAMVTATSKGGLFFEGMKRGAATLPGIWSTLMDTIGMTTREVVGLSDTGEVVAGGLVEQVKNAITDLTGFLSANQGAIANFFKEGFGWIVDNSTLIVGAIVGGITPALYGMATALLASPLLPFIAAGLALGAAVKIIVEALGGWEETQKKLSTAIAAFGDAFNKYVRPAVDELMKSITSELLPALQELWSVVGPILGPVLKVLGTILGGVVVAGLRLTVEVLKFVVNQITDTAKAVTGFINFVKGIPGAVSAGFSAVGSFFSALGNAISGGIDGAIKTVKTGITIIRGLFDLIFKGDFTGEFGRALGISEDSPVMIAFFDFRDGVIGTWNSIVTGVQSAIATFTAVVTAIASPFVWIYSNIIQPISMLIEAVILRVFYEIGKFIMDRTIEVANFLSAVWTSIVAFLTPIFTAISNTVTQTWNSIVSAIDYAMTYIDERIITPIVEGIIDFMTWAWNGLRDFFVGLWNGIKLAAQSAWTAIKDAVTGPVNTAKTNTTNTFTEIKNWLVDTWNGIYNFFTGMAGKIVDAIVKPFTDAKNKIEDIAANIKDAANQINPFHRNSPSLVDNVKAGIGQIVDEYRSLKSISLPSLSGLAPSLPEQPAFAAVGTSQDFQPTTQAPAGGNQYITFEEVNVREENDIDSMVREMGFMASLSPGIAL